jgi:hypothetical protein
MFARGVPQRDDLGIFTVAYRTIWASTHGDLLLRNCHLPIILCWFISPSLWKDDDVCNVARFPSVINLSRCLLRSSIGMSGAVRSFACSRAAPGQSGAETFDQGVSVEGLGQESGRSRLRSSRASTFHGEGRDENERHPVSPRKQVGLQIGAAHRRHLNIRYHTRRVIQPGRLQEFFGRRKCMDDVPKRSYEIVGRGANGSVIVNDRNDRWIAQNGPSRGRRQNASRCTAA